LAAFDCFAGAGLGRLAGASELISTVSGAFRDAAFNKARQHMSDTPTHTIITIAITQ
jgi:hypothetical protein